MRNTIHWSGTEDDQHLELKKACKARCKRWGKEGCPQPDHFCAECEHDMAVALRTQSPQKRCAVTNTGTPIPALGYPSRTAAVRALRSDGLSYAEIGQRIGISAKNAASLVTTKREQVKSKLPMPASYKGVPVNFETRKALRADAAARGMTTDALIQLLIETIASDQLVDAVLDDRAGAK